MQHVKRILRQCYVVSLVSFYGRIKVHCTYQIGYALTIYFRDNISA